jgi:protein arginine kinase
MNVDLPSPVRRRRIRLPAWCDGSGPESDIIITTRIRLARNIAGFSFPPHASPVERTAVYGAVTGALKAFGTGSTMKAFNFSTTSQLEAQYLVERRIASPDLLSTDGDRGVACDATQRLSVMINEEDHIRMQCLVSGCQPIDAWKQIDAFDAQLGTAVDYAFERRRGFLTCCPTNSGTGLRVSFLVHLPGLILTKSLDAVLQGASQLGIAARGFFGEHSDAVGSIVQLSNHTTIGACETEFIENTLSSVQEIIACEQRARERLLSEARLELSDKIYRAWGILAYARTLSVAEFMNCSSALRLGRDTGLFTEISRKELNAGMLVVLPAHLQKHTGRPLDKNEIPLVRAERVRSLFFKKRTGSLSDIVIPGGI